MIRKILEAIDEKVAWDPERGGARQRGAWAKKDPAPKPEPEPAKGAMDVLEAVRQAILEVLGDYIADYLDTMDPGRVKQRIEDNTFTGEEDPGGWVPRSYVVIHHESGVPDAFSSAHMFEKWVKIGNRASELSGVPMFNESINPAVSAMYKA